MPYLNPAEQTLPFQAESETSRDAAVANRETAEIQRERVYREIAQWMGGRTQKELARVLGMERASVAPRCHELERAGRIRKTDERRESCHVYRVAT